MTGLRLSSLALSILIGCGGTPPIDIDGGSRDAGTTMDGSPDSGSRDGGATDAGSPEAGTVEDAAPGADASADGGSSDAGPSSIPECTDPGRIVLSEPDSEGSLLELRVASRPGFAAWLSVEQNPGWASTPGGWPHAIVRVGIVDSEGALCADMPAEWTYDVMHHDCGNILTVPTPFGTYTLTNLGGVSRDGASPWSGTLTVASCRTFGLDSAFFRCQWTTGGPC
ncbi:MAG: hypothetical protein IT378_23090 [Sandaracinaceae bacterium]|nr:hypothetical protein [Sandaracinaceae bacterium]